MVHGGSGPSLPGCVSSFATYSLGNLGRVTSFPDLSQREDRGSTHMSSFLQSAYLEQAWHRVSTTIIMEKHQLLLEITDTEKAGEFLSLQLLPGSSVIQVMGLLLHCEDLSKTQCSSVWLLVSA